MLVTLPNEKENCTGRIHEVSKDGVFCRSISQGSWLPLICRYHCVLDVAFAGALGVDSSGQAFYWYIAAILVQPDLCLSQTRDFLPHPLLWDEKRTVENLAERLKALQKRGFGAVPC